MRTQLDFFFSSNLQMRLRELSDRLGPVGNGVLSSVVQVSQRHSGPKHIQETGRLLHRPSPPLSVTGARRGRIVRRTVVASVV